MDRFLNHTHPPLRATSFLREVNLGTACGCEVFFDLDVRNKSEHDSRFVFIMDRHTGLHPVRDDVQMIFYKPFLSSP